MVGKDSPRLSKDEFKKRISDPDLMFLSFLNGWENTRNPYYVWNAIHLCTEHNRQFPEWVLLYLAECSTRMLAPDAKKSNDLRKILPSILGFPAKRGPGKPLDPDQDPNDVMELAIRFAIEIEKGMDPPAARREATKYLPRRRADKIDDKTLQVWLKKHFGLKKSPRTNAEWKYILHRFYGHFVKVISAKFRETQP